MVAITALLLLVGTLVVLAAVGAFIAFAVRRNQHERRRMALASQCFAGQPQAVVQVATWGLPVADIRQVAGQRGYAEVPNADPSVLVFQQMPGAPSGGVPASSPTATGAGGAPPHAPLRKRERLIQRLACEEFAWADTAVTGGTAADIAALANQHGAHILRTFGDRTRPVLLIGKRPINSVRDVVPSGRGLSSQALWWLSNGLAGAAILVLIITQLATDAATMVNWLLTGLSVLALFASAAIHTAPALRDITVRMNRLIREFDGRPMLTVIAQQYRLDPYAYVDAATELGYQQIDSMHGWRTSSRWNDARLKFVRR